LVIDDEETLILEEESQSKMSKKEKDPEAIEQNLLAEQAFWLRISNPTIESSNKPLVIMEVPSEIPKVSLVNASHKRLKFHLAQFDSVVKKRTTPNARTKELLLENDRLLQQMIVMHSMSLIGEYVNMDRKRNESCDKCFNLDVEPLKSQNAHNDLLKSYPELEKHSQLQDKDTTICKLKEIIKSIRENKQEDKVNDINELETINVELENSVAKLLSDNERLCKEINHVKQVFKDQFDSIKKTCVRTKEHSDSLIAKLNLKSVENEDLKAQIQDKELLVYVRDTCPNAIKLSDKKVVVTPMNKVKKVRIEVFY
ncbi:hypothetical protein Tco_1488406, partial [Tanacetum coccineum]